MFEACHILEEESPHSASHAMSVMYHVEFVHKLKVKVIPKYSL